MLRFNSKMQSQLAKLSAGTHKNKKQHQISTGGFFEHAGCFFLKEFYQSHFDQYTISQFHDKTGFEAFVNSIHVRDYHDNAFLEYSLNYIRDIFEEFEASIPNRILKASLSLSEDNSVIKFYVSREGQEYLSNDLEGYDSALMEATKSGLARIKF